MVKIDKTQLKGGPRVTKLHMGKWIMIKGVEESRREEEDEEACFIRKIFCVRSRLRLNAQDSNEKQHKRMRMISLRATVERISSPELWGGDAGCNMKAQLTQELRATAPPSSEPEIAPFNPPTPKTLA